MPGAGRSPTGPHGQRQRGGRAAGQGRAGARQLCALGLSPRAGHTWNGAPGTRRPRAGSAMTVLEGRALESPPGRSLGLQPRGGKWGGAGKVEY